MRPASAPVRVLVPQAIAPQRPGSHAPVRTFGGRSMGCAWSVRWVPEGAAPSAAELQQGVQATLDRVVAQMSTWEPGSELSRYNRAAAGTWHALPREFARVLGCALYVADASEGACDPTAGPLVDLWGFGPRGRHDAPGFEPPGEAAVAAARRRCGWQRLEADTAALRVFQPGGLQLDLSAVAKGYGVDAVSEFLAGAGVAHHLVELGGELRGSGMKPDGQPWWVEIEQPPGASGLPRTRVALHGLALATSGDYLQTYDRAGCRISHCLDPRSGQPLANDVAAVSVLLPSCMEADAWSTALMVSGPEAGLALAERLHLPACMLVRRGAALVEYTSRAWEALVVLPR